MHRGPLIGSRGPAEGGPPADLTKAAAAVRGKEGQWIEKDSTHENFFCNRQLTTGSALDPIAFRHCEFGGSSAFGPGADGRGRLLPGKLDPMKDFSPLNEAHVADARAAVAEAVIGLRSGKMTFVDAVRTISACRFRLPGARDNPDFLLFAAIDSETAHVPAAHMRAQCSPSWLEACDREQSKLSTVHAEALIGACESILLLVDGQACCGVEVRPSADNSNGDFRLLANRCSQLPSGT